MEAARIQPGSQVLEIDSGPGHVADMLVHAGARVSGIDFSSKDSLDPVLKGFWDWGDMAALPAETQAKIEETTRENARPYEKHGGYAFPHSILFGSALKA